MLMNKPNPHGGDTYNNNVRYDFSANTNPLGTPEAVKQTVIDSVDMLSAYPDPYCTELRKAISVHHGINMDNIICGNGAAELIYTFAAAYQPKSVCIIEPTFCEYENSLHCEISHVFDLNKHYDVIYLCNPNNPTGAAMLRDDVLRLCRNCDMLFVDECFMDLSDKPEQCTLMNDVSENIFILKAFTKSYGMAGLRLGYGVTENTNLLTKMSELTQTWNVSTIAQTVGVAALRCDDFIIATRKIIHDERLFLTNELKNLGFNVYNSTVNFILFQTDRDLYNELLKRQILIRRCNNFHGLDDTYYRCAVKCHGENVILIDNIKEIVNG